MKWNETIEEFLTDMQAQGRLNSASSLRAYRDTISWHRDDVKGGLAPGHRKFERHKQQLTGRNDVKRTLSRWKHPTTQANRHAIIQRFYDWCMEEGYRKDNPARQVTRARKRKPQVYRMTEDEVRAFLGAASTERERRVAYLGVCCGFRSAELRSLQVQNFMRDGMVEVVGKGGKYRQLPVTTDLVPVVTSILKGEPDDYVIPAQYNSQPGNINPRTGDPWGAERWRDLKKQPASAQSIWRIVEDVARRAGIRAHIHPHLMRHAFGDHIARHGGLQLAQYLMGHADPSTTKTYVGDPRFEDLQAAVGAFTFGVTSEEHTNIGSPARQEAQFPQSYRHGDSNPGYTPRVMNTDDHSVDTLCDDEFEWDEEVGAA